ncbi:MAG: amidohydrolase family protein, partial [Actinobacteria bacterium]|nr:amidohydrolase family protein [Actinomycetota bacterium]MBU1493716.1 amidohydrolase family protein [Actinomycetota bacterium]
VGPMSEFGEQTADDEIDLHGMLVIPGLMNGHNHHWGSMFKHTGERLLLEPWLDIVALPILGQLSNDDLRIANYLEGLSQIRTGTTCSLNHMVNNNTHESLEATIQPVLEVGVRQVVATPLRETPDPPFSTKYPAVPHIRSREEELAITEEFIDRWDGKGGTIHMGLVVESGANWMLHNATSDQIILDGVELAQRRGLKISNHCSAGTPWLSILEFHQMTGGGDVDYLVRLGAMSDVWTLIHSLHLTDREIDHVARWGASIVHNPVSNAYSTDGIAPVKQMFAAGVNVGLGTDGVYVNCSLDMVQQMKFAALLQQIRYFDHLLMSAERMIEMATINCAKAMGIDHLVGSIEVGKKADIAVFDLDTIPVPVVNRPLAALVFTANGTDADTVLVNGKVVLRDKQFVDFDKDQQKQIVEEATRRAREAIERAGIADRTFVPWRPYRQPGEYEIAPLGAKE